MFSLHPVPSHSLDEVFHELTRGLRILLVEDNIDQQEIVGRFLRGSSALLSRATTGKDAFKQLHSRRFDLLILDIMLPDVDGWEIFSEVRKHPNYQKTPVLFLTCVVPPSEEKLASDEHGYCRTLSKPCSRTDFRRAIIALLRG
jgi:DNA-binding response OmpR family regulator